MAHDTMVNRVLRAAKADGVSLRGETILAAVSGGADSTALLLALHRLSERVKFRLVAAHLHHGIRGREADADARHVRRLCRALGVRCIVGRADVPRRAARRRISIEMAAREARRKFLAGAALRARASCVALGHTSDDQAETVLMRVLRGTGVQGLGGIRPVSRWDALLVWRPLLGVRHREAEAYCRDREVSWREDETNRDPTMLRNRVRQELLPLLEVRYNAAVRAALHRLAAIARDEDDLLNEWMESRVRDWGQVVREGMEVDVLRAMPLALRRRAWVRWLAEAGVPASDTDYDAVTKLEGLLKSAHGSRAVPLSGSWKAVRSYDRILLRRAGGVLRPQGFVARLREGTQSLRRAGCQVTVRKDRGFRRVASAVGRLPSECWLDRAAVGRSPLYIRSWCPGDRMRPVGAAGSVKVQDLFTNAKIPREARSSVPLLVCRDQVVWVPGHRVDRAWAVRSPGAASVHVRIAPAR